MLSSLTLAVALTVGAPLPRVEPMPGGGVVPTGSPPRVLELKPDEDGKIRLTVYRMAAAAQVAGAKNLMARRLERVELTDLADLTASTVGGKSVTKEELSKAVASGGVVVVPADGKSLPNEYRKLFRDDILIVMSPDLANLPPVARLGAAGLRPIGAGPGNAPIKPVDVPAPAK